MAISQQLNEKRAHMKENRMERELDHAEQETLELKTENRSLRDQVDRDQEERDRLVDLLGKLERAVEKGGKGKRGRRSAFALMGLGAFAAWLFGSQSGRRKVAQFKDRVMGHPKVQDLHKQAEDITGQARDAAQQTKDAAQDIAQQTKDAAQDIAQQTKDAAKDIAQQTKQRPT